MAIHFYERDLPDGLDLGPMVAIDSETLGLNPLRDRLCLVQLSSGDGDCHLVQIEAGQSEAPNLTRMLADENVLKLFHFARFDLAVLMHTFAVTCQPVYCTKIVSKLVRTYTDRHGLKDLCKELLGIDISKQQQSSDWASSELSEAQKLYAATDVLHLHQIHAILEQRLDREDRRHMAEASFAFLPMRAELDLAGFEDMDIFAHS